MADQMCDEAADACQTLCDVSGDADGDGHDAIDCGGDDCDDRSQAFHPVCREKGKPITRWSPTLVGDFLATDLGRIFRRSSRAAR